jgi:hypothetical protein
MTKINFTTENETRLKVLFVELGFTKEVLSGKFGANTYTVWDVLHLLQLDTLEFLYNNLEKEIEVVQKKGRNKWLETNTATKKVEKLSKWYEFVDLVLGYKMYQAEVGKKASKLAEARAELKAMKEEVKTPAERIAEMEKQIEELEK